MRATCSLYCRVVCVFISGLAKGVDEADSHVGWNFLLLPVGPRTFHDISKSCSPELSAVACQTKNNP